MVSCTHAGATLTPQKLWARVLTVAVVVSAWGAGPVACTATRGATRDDGRPLTTVYLIHGIAADTSVFGFMARALETHLRSGDPSRRFEIVPFDYDTVSNTKDTFVFAQDLDADMHKRFGGRMGPQDRISFVTHSQGGLVAAIWLANALFQREGFHTRYAEHVDAYVSLAVPFWGARTATAALPAKEIPVVGGFPSMAPFYRIPGRVQLREMAFGSETIFSFRQGALRWLHDPTVAARCAHIRPLNIGAVASFIPAIPLMAGANIYEEDTAVPLPSARFDFIAGAMDTPADILPSSSFVDVHAAEFRAVSAMHHSPAPALPSSARGVAQIPPRCVLTAACDHPSFTFMLQHILNKPVPQDESVLAGLTSFMLDINMHFSGENAPATADVNVQVLQTPPQVELSGITNPYGAGFSHVVRAPGWQRFYLFGQAEGTYLAPPRRANEPAFADRAVVLRVAAKGYKPVEVHARVRATYTTYVKLELVPYDVTTVPAAPGSMPGR